MEFVVLMIILGLIALPFYLLTEKQGRLARFQHTLEIERLRLASEERQQAAKLAHELALAQLNNPATPGGDEILALKAKIQSLEDLVVLQALRNHTEEEEVA
jgi:hypothetical protein